MKKWDVVLLSYPFTDLTGTKVRPAVVLSPDSENSAQDDGLFLLVTSNTARISRYDLVVDSGHKEFTKTGLRKSSALRINKLVTLKQTLIRRTLGKIGPELRKDITSRLRGYLDL
ncbi:MAG: type II toxin-antitoxin system PemK/MazF family toxin [Kiritimatiellia bacterium]